MAYAYARLAGIPATFTPTKGNSCRFGGTVTLSLGTNDIRLPFAPGLYAKLTVDVVVIEVPLMLGIVSLDALRVYVNNIEGQLKCDKRGISTHLTLTDGHIYLESVADIHYTTTELRRLQRHLSHPQPGRQTALLRRARDPNATPGTRAHLDELTKECDVFQRLARTTCRFRVALPPEDISFNRLVLLDLMYLDGKTVLHILDTDTPSSAAAFLHGETV